jgi:glutaredoxin
MRLRNRVRGSLGIALWCNLCVALLFLSFACRQKPKQPALTLTSQPKVEFTDTTKDVLLTWVDDQGDFHVAQSVSDVKAENREQVRVVFTEGVSDNPDQVTVADLRQKGPDGKYPIRPMSRTAWEEIGASHRKSRLEAISAPTSALGDAGNQGTGVIAVIYGAEWCRACHETAQYLTTKGIKFEEKDVDKSSVIQAELQAKMQRAHVPATSSIPVTDIGGHLVVGFNPTALDAALAATRN